MLSDLQNSVKSSPKIQEMACPEPPRGSALPPTFKKSLLLQILTKTLLFDGFFQNSF